MALKHSVMDTCVPFEYISYIVTKKTHSVTFFSIIYGIGYLNTIVLVIGQIVESRNSNLSFMSNKVRTGEFEI